MSGKSEKLFSKISIENNRILTLAIPATIENILQTLVGFIDTLMIAKIGLLAVTAVGVANTLLNVYLAVFIALGVGASALISQKLGAKDAPAAQNAAAQVTVLAIIGGIVFGLLSIFAGAGLLKLMGANSTTLAYSRQFFMIVGGGAVFMALMTVFGSILRAGGDTESPMKVSVIVNLGNIVLDYILIFGLGPIPALGVVGTAIGTVISRMIGCWLLFKKVQNSATPLQTRALFKSDYRPLISLAVPATLERLVMRLGQVVYFGLIVGIGAKTFAAHSIAGNIESFTYMPAYGLATAATTLVGNSIGAKDLQRSQKYAFKAATYGVVFMSMLGLVLFFGAPYFARIFTHDPSAIQQVTTALRIDAFAQPALAVSLITTGSLQGMGDTKSPLYSTAIGMWGIRVIGVIILAKLFSLGIAGIWLSIALDLYLRAFFLTFKFYRNLKHSPSSH